MKYTRITILTLILIVMLTSLPGCLFNGHSGRTHASRLDLQSATHTDVYTHQLPESARKLTLSMEIKADAGSLRWQVVDPNGNVKWEGEAVAGGKVNESRQLDLIAGEWTLDMDLENASGSYEIEFLSR